MREIFFRVWTGSSMEYDVIAGRFGAFYINPGFRGDGLDDSDSASLTLFNTKYNDAAHVMQYTGLKDKNGKPIYEEDILRLERGAGCHAYNMDDPDPDTRIVAYDENGAPELLLIDGKPQGSGLTWCKANAENCFVVIGNMHEHPELISQEVAQ